MGDLVRKNDGTETDGIFEAPDLRKGVISIFCVVPAAGALLRKTEVQDYIDSFGGVPAGFNAVMFGIIPLFTWGPQQDATEYTWGTSTITIDTFPGGHSDVVLDVITGSTVKQTPPSFIGVFVDNTGALSLIVHIQTKEAAVCSNTVTVGTGAHWDPPGALAGDGNIVKDSADASYVDEAKPDYFGNAGIAPSDGSNRADFNRPAITAGTEVPIHILISYDVSAGAQSVGVLPDATEIGTSAGTVTVSKLWCAIDGVNKAGTDLPAMWAHIDTEEGDPNEMLSFITASVAGNRCGGLALTPSATLTTNATSIPFSPTSIPSATSLLREGTPIVPNVKIKEARIQMFAGVTADTGNPDVVRAFRNDDGTPAPEAAARALLGVDPIVEFVNGVAFKNGSNSGTKGNFTASGTINTIDTPT